MKRIVEAAVEEQRRDNDRRQYHQDEAVGAELLVLKIVFYGNVPPREEVQREVNAGDEHEKHGDEIDRGAVEIGDARIVGRETANRNGRESVTKRVEPAHAGDPVTNQARDRERKIDVPQRLRRLRDARSELRVLHRPRRLGAIKLHAADAQHR